MEAEEVDEELGVSAGWADVQATVEEKVQEVVEEEIRDAVPEDLDEASVVMAEEVYTELKLQEKEDEQREMDSDATHHVEPEFRTGDDAIEPPSTQVSFEQFTSCRLPILALGDAVRHGQVELFLLEWLTAAETILTHDTSDSQAFIEEAMHLCGARRNASPSVLDTISPGRGARSLLARCVVQVYRDEEAEKLPLFDFVNALQEAVAQDAVKADTLVRHMAAMEVLGAIFRAFDSAAGRSHSTFVPVCLRLARAQSSPVLARCKALWVLEGMLMHQGVGSMPATSIKEFYKTLRSLLQEPAGPLVRASCACLEVLCEQHDALRSRQELESLVAQSGKILSTCDVATRNALAELIARLLFQTEPKPHASKAADSDQQEAMESAAPKPTETVPLYSVKDMLNIVCMNVPLRPNASSQARIGTLQVYSAILAYGGAAWVETHYAEVYTHIIDTLVQRAYAQLRPGELLQFRQGVQLLLLHFMCATISEPGLERAAVQIGNDWLSQWPPRTPQSQVPTDLQLEFSLESVTGIIAQLGGVGARVEEALCEPIITLLRHLSRPVQVRAAWWLRVASEVNPRLLAKSFSRLLEFVKRDVAAMQQTQHDQGVSLRARMAGHSSALGALVGVAAANPLHAMNQDAEEVFSLATHMLQQVAEFPLDQAAAAISAAWTLLSSLMNLGPLFIRPHLGRFVQLWRNAFALPSNLASLDESAYTFLLHVRANALNALLSFFLHGGLLVLTSEGTRRVVSMLSHVLVLLESMPSSLQSVSDTNQLAMRVRTLLLRCCTQLAQEPMLEALHASLIRLALQMFAEPNRFAGSTAQAAISSSLGVHTELWSVADQYAYGVTNMLRARCDGIQGATTELHEWQSPYVPCAYRAPTSLASAQLYGVSASLQALGNTPILGSLEYDPAILSIGLLNHSEGTDEFCVRNAELPAPEPVATAEVNAGIELFASLYAFMERETQISAAEYLVYTTTRAASLDKMAFRRMAVLTNCIVALLGALRTATSATTRQRTPAGFANDRIAQAIRTVAETGLLQGDSMLRASAAELYGRLASIAGSQALATQMQFVVAHIVDHRNAEARASCACAAGQVYARVGGLHASPWLKTISRLLGSLAQDPHPVVHCAALDALQWVIDASSLGYQSYVPSVMTVLSKLDALPTHEPQGGSIGSSNLRATLSTNSAVARVASALVGVLGADLQQEPKRCRELYALLYTFATNPSEGMLAVTDSIQGLQRLGVILPETLDTKQYADLLAKTMQRSDQQRSECLLYTRVVASAYYQMAQRGTHWLAQYGGRRLLHEMFLKLDQAPMLAELRAFLLTWLQQSALERPCAWVDLCGRLLLEPKHFSTQLGTPSGNQELSGGNSTMNEESAALATDKQGTTPALHFGWRTKFFVLECLDAVLGAVRYSPHVGQQADASDLQNLASRVGDMIKMAFAASTAVSRAVRCAGLQVLQAVMELYATTRDPAFPSAKLLEQYQAPLAAALTPAFASDSFPEVLALAISVCAVYVAVGGVSESETAATNRIVKLLLHALNDSSADPMTRIGDLENVSHNAAIYLQMAVLHAWAKLAIAQQSGQARLESVLEPHRVDLTRRWGEALAKYAVLREECAMAMTESTTENSDSIAELDQAQQLVYYQDAWPAMLQAMTLALRQKSESGASDVPETSTVPVPYTSLYALALETVCQQLERRESSMKPGTFAIVLASLPVLADARYAGEALADAAMFDEILRVLQRAFGTHHVPIALGILQVVRKLVQTMHERLLQDPDGSVNDRHFAQTQLGCVVRMLYSYLEEVPSGHGSLADQVALLNAIWSTILSVMHVCTPEVQRLLIASVLHWVLELARREDAAARALGSTLRPLLGTIAAEACNVADASLKLVVHGFLCGMLGIASAMRTRSGAIVSLKSRNALVGVAEMLTVLDARIPVSIEVLDTFTYLVGSKFCGNPQEVQVAFQCIALVQPSSGRLRTCRLAIGALLPELQQWITTACTSLENCESDQETEDLVTLVLNALQIVCTIPEVEANTTSAYCVVLPVLVRILQYNSPSNARYSSSLYETVCSKLVSFAQRHAMHFKAATSALPPEHRQLLQNALRSAMGVAHGPRLIPRNEARIALKTFGS
ncbi:hypothetical protein MYAM1_003983 [Malassezia yamatoensis]|uniref:LAA1-like C-terminal TPR repeats domain-containing protein n=1 Tax=Malassezia yamatoensis TaxID=253288 RepID=A0AAJ5YVW4_9BASI|nr:hypothetical protein MYAM1_003983 [Malassezia yamatoensis]